MSIIFISIKPNLWKTEWRVFKRVFFVVRLGLDILKDSQQILPDIQLCPDLKNEIKPFHVRWSMKERAKEF